MPRHSVDDPLKFVTRITRQIFLFFNVINYTSVNVNLISPLGTLFCRRIVYNPRSEYEPTIVPGINEENSRKRVIRGGPRFSAVLFQSSDVGKQLSTTKFSLTYRTSYSLVHPRTFHASTNTYTNRHALDPR